RRRDGGRGAPAHRRQQRGATGLAQVRRGDRHDQEHLDSLTQRYQHHLSHDFSVYAVRISFPFCVRRSRYSRPLWTITSSWRWPSSTSLVTRTGKRSVSLPPCRKGACFRSTNER